MAAHARDVNIFIWTSLKSVDHGTNDRIMVHGDDTRADGRRSGSGAPISQDPVVASPTRRAEHLWVSEQCSIQSSRLDGPSRNRSASNANLSYNSSVWGLSGAPSPHRRPRRTGKSVDREENNGVMVHLDGVVADTRIFSSWTRLHETWGREVGES